MGRRLPALLLLVAAASGCSPRDTLRDLYRSWWIGPNVAWETASPEAVELDGERLEAFGQSLATRGTDALLIAKDGRLVYEEYGGEHWENSRHGVAAAAKGLVGSLALVAAGDDGLVGLDEAAARWIPPWREDASRRAITLRQLASHTSGLEDVPFLGNRGARHTVAWMRRYEGERDSRFALALARVPVSGAPGVRYRYSGAGYYALAYALGASLHAGSGSVLPAWMQARLFDPLGIPPDAWSMSYGQSYAVDGMTLFACGSGATFTARAMARRGGRWDGASVLSLPAVEELVRDPLSPPPERRLGETWPGWGLGWTLNRDGYFPSLPRDSFMAVGAHHKIVLVVPSLALVVVRTGEDLGPAGWTPGFWRELETELLAPLMAAVGAAPTV